LRQFSIDGLDHVAINVRNVSRSVAWYCDVLGLERQHQEVWGDYPAVVAAGGSGLALFPVQGDSPKPRPGRDVLTMRHVAFRVSGSSFAAAQRELAARGITFEFQDHQISRSIYLHDPDGHEIELTTYDLV
jgi:catechol 2,3-dioxygenase-like lactoylglutathione lyase family enzyme